MVLEDSEARSPSAHLGRRLTVRRRALAAGSIMRRNPAIEGALTTFRWWSRKVLGLGTSCNQPCNEVDVLAKCAARETRV